jgi:hypothetical protein
MSAKTLPIEDESVNELFSEGGGRLYLLKALILVTPEGSPPLAVEKIYIVVVFLSAPFNERSAAVFAMALSVYLV